MDCSGVMPAPGFTQRHPGLERTHGLWSKETGGLGPQTLPLRGPRTALMAPRVPVGPELGQHSQTSLSGPPGWTHY